MPNMSSFAPLESIRFCILLAIAKKPMRGADIERQIMIDSRNSIHIGFSTIYKTLKNLEQKSLVQKITPPYFPGSGLHTEKYTLTPHGQSILKQEIHRLKDTLAASPRPPQLNPPHQKPKSAAA